MLKVAVPATRLAMVVPPSREALSVTVIEFVAAVAGMPLSVRVSAGAGSIGRPVATKEGGSMLKASA